MSSKTKKEKGKAQSQGQGAFVCGKCTQRFPKAHGLAIHILRRHKGTWGKGSAAAKTAPIAKPAKARKSVMVCAKCGRDKFPKGPMSYMAHRRYCKGSGQAPVVQRAPAVLTPAPFPAVRTVGSGQPIRTEAAHSSNGHNQIDRLKAAAAQKRREAEEIEKLVASFEADAQKFLSK